MSLLHVRCIDVEQIRRSVRTAVAAGDALRAARSSGPFSERKAEKKGTARLKKCGVAPLKSLISLPKTCRNRLSAASWFEGLSKKGALVRELSRAAGPKNAKMSPPRVSRYYRVAPRPAKSASSPLRPLWPTSRTRLRTTPRRPNLPPPASDSASPAPYKTSRHHRRASSPPRSTPPPPPLKSPCHLVLSHARSLALFHPRDCYCDWCLLLLFLAPPRRKVAEAWEVSLA